MASSRKPGPLNPWRSPGGLLPARSPGILGYLDQGDPFAASMLGDTPGVLGRLDGADVTLPFTGWLNAGLTLSAEGRPICMPVSADRNRLIPASHSAITAAQLKQVFPAGESTYLEQVASELNSDPHAFGLETAQRKAHFFAQVREEAGSGLSATVENLRYSAKALKSTFGYYKKHPDEAETDGYAKDAKGKVTDPADQESIANKAYGSRMGNGDAASGDGWRFRGRGLFQLTGRSNYAAMAKRYLSVYKDGVDFEKDPDKVALFPHSVRSAVCFWLEHGLPELADRGHTGADVDRITAVINKATHSYADRRSNFELAYRAFS